MGIATAYLAQMNGGFNDERGTPGHDLRRPMSTINTKGANQQLVTAHLAHFRGNCDARDVRQALMTVSAGGQHHGIVECTLSRAVVRERALRVARFLLAHHPDLAGLRLVEEEDLLALVTVVVDGTSFVIIDIGLRMLEPDELFRATGFLPSYIFTRGHDGRQFPKSRQVKFVGNAVPPELIEAVLRANYSQRQPQRLAA